MRSLRASFLTAVLVSAACSAPVASAQNSVPNLYVSLTLANDYRSRGLSALESGVSWQLAADYEHASGFFAGALVANVDYERKPVYGEPREQVVDYYAGYSFGRRKWKFNVALGGYEYPDMAVDYNYREWSFGARLMNRVFYTASYTDDLYSSSYSAWHHELGMAQPLPWDLELSAAIGEVRTDLVAYGGYTHWNIGVSKVMRRTGLDLRFHESSLDQVSYLGNPGGDRWVLSVSYGFAPGSRAREGK
jgi:uncharacterized protein (TIGR02001 family)